MTTHQIHSYAASFGRDLARDLLSRFGSQNIVVLDPFAGSGISLIESLSLGNKSIGIDVDPIACLVCRTQTRIYTEESLLDFEKKTLKQLFEFENEIISSNLEKMDINAGSTFELNGMVATIPNKPAIDFWFSKTQKIILAVLIQLMQSFEDSRIRDIFAVSISSAIIRKWPNTLSLAMDIDHSRPHRALPTKNTIAEQFVLFRRVFQKTIKGLIQLVPLSKNWPGEATVLEGDCIERIHYLESGSVDLILTSPPYVNAIDYPRAHKFAEWWLSPSTQLCRRENYIGLRGSAKETEFLINLKDMTLPNLESLHNLIDHQSLNKSILIRYLSDIAKVIEGFIYVLKPSGKVVLVLANNRFGGKTIPITNIVTEMLESKGFSDIQTLNRTIKSDRRRYPFGFKGIMKDEAIITATK